MSTKIYRLQVVCSGEEYTEKISILLGIKPSERLGHIWSLEIKEKEDDEYFDCIRYYLDILEGRYEKLASIGVSKDDISVWLLYEYDNECNMEFSPDDLKRLGDNGISLCISCWPA